MTIFKNKKYIFDGGMGQLLIDRGMVTKGTLWSATALIDESLNDLVIDSHLEFINAGAEIIITNNFKVRKNTFFENQISDKFDFANKKAGQLALKAKNISQKNILIGGSIPTRGITYQPNQDYDESTVFNEFNQTATQLNPYVDFFYLDVITSAKEIEAACEITEKMNMPVLVGLHLKKNGKVASGETITEIVKKYKSNNWIGLIGACVSLEIIENSVNELLNLNMPFGFKANLWKVDEPLPVHKFNTRNFLNL